MAGLRIAAIRLLSRDPPRLGAFLQGALGFEPVDENRLRLGREILEIEPTNGAPYPPDMAANDTRFQHFAVIVSDMDAAYGRLGETPGWTAISLAGPEALPAASGGASAFKFRSPEGHPLELLRFPRRGTPAPWDARTGLHLGIDHAAIGVRDTDASVAFYASLGFRVAARQTNRGPEQGRLDGLGGSPDVEVTALSPPGGTPPHLELLCYRNPHALASRHAQDDDVAATRLVLADLGEDTADPDGHRWTPGRTERR